MPEPIPTVILGATGYVAGELLRLLASHPTLELGAAVSRSRAGESVGDVFPNLAAAYPEARLADESAILRLFEAHDRVAVFSATPHGETAVLVARWMAAAEAAHCKPAWVDISADFRLRDVQRWSELYDLEHPHPEWVERFTCNLPELCPETPDGPIAHPGCFTTAVTLACAPLHALGLCEPQFMVSAVTGSTGSGRTPGQGTHHPERHADFKAYNPLRHRHAAEMEALIGAVGDGPVEVAFVPHSGPFARGIHATVQARRRAEVPVASIAEKVREYYADAPFVIVGEGLPRLKEVVGSNLCRIGVVADGDRVVVCSAIDNLTKGAAGGAVQWANRLLELDPLAGLPLHAAGWI